MSREVEEDYCHKCNTTGDKSWKDPGACAPDPCDCKYGAPLRKADQKYDAAVKEILTTPRPSAAWTFQEAATFLLELEIELKKVGYHVGLLGSVLHEGWSPKDLDIVVYPHRSTGKIPSPVDLSVHFGNMGLRLIYNSKKVRSFWKAMGSNDKKTVEVWALGTKRVDIFFMQ